MDISCSYLNHTPWCFFCFAGLVISLLFLATQMYVTPYGTTALNTVQSTSLLANILTLFVGLMLIIDSYLEEASIRSGSSYDLTGRSVISVIILLVNIAVVVLPILVKMMNSDALKTKISKLFSNNIQKMEPVLLPDYASHNHDKTQTAAGEVVVLESKIQTHGELIVKEDSEDTRIQI